MENNYLLYAAWANADIERDGDWNVFMSDGSGYYLSEETYMYSTDYLSLSAGQLFMRKNLNINVFYFKGDTLSSIEYPESLGKGTMKGRMLPINGAVQQKLIRNDLNARNFDLRSNILPYTDATKPNNHPIIIQNERGCFYVTYADEQLRSESLGEASLCTQASVKDHVVKNCSSLAGQQTNYCLMDGLNGIVEDLERVDIEVAGSNRKTEKFHALLGCNGFQMVKLKQPREVITDDGRMKHIVTHELYVYMRGESGTGTEQVACYEVPPKHMYGIVIDKNWVAAGTTASCASYTPPLTMGSISIKGVICGLLKTRFLFGFIIFLDVILTIVMIVAIIIERAGHGRKFRAGIHRRRRRYSRTRGSRSSRSDVTTNASTYAPKSGVTL